MTTSPTRFKVGANLLRRAVVVNLSPRIRRLISPVALVGVGLLVGGGLVALGNHDGGAKKAHPGELATSASSTTAPTATVVEVATTTPIPSTSGPEVTTTTRKPVTTTSTTRLPATTTSSTTTTTRPAVTTTTAPAVTTTTAHTWARVPGAYAEAGHTPSGGSDLPAGTYRVHWSCSTFVVPYGCTVTIRRATPAGYTVWKKVISGLPSAPADPASGTEDVVFSQADRYYLTAGYEPGGSSAYVDLSR